MVNERKARLIFRTDPSSVKHAKTFQRKKTWSKCTSSMKWTHEYSAGARKCRKTCFNCKWNDFFNVIYFVSHLFRNYASELISTGRRNVFDNYAPAIQQHVSYNLAYKFHSVTLFRCSTSASTFDLKFSAIVLMFIASVDVSGWLKFHPQTS
jgi:hypothetical protein